VIDGDVGQADIGPPTTTSASIVSEHLFSLQELKPEKSYFIGDTSPSSVPEKLVRALVRHKHELSRRSEITILNTDGWVREDEAVEHKLDLIDSLQPDLVLGLSFEHELDNILARQRCQTLRLEASSFTRTRTREERKKAREEGYRRFLRNPRQLDIKVNSIELRTFNKPRQQRIDQGSTYKGTLAGLLDEKEFLLSIGRIERITNGIVRITTMAKERPKIVELGAVVLSPRFGEVGFEP
jgi:polynucleotide 5'-kinase involved in rRNA processing